MSRVEYRRGHGILATGQVGGKCRSIEKCVESCAIGGLRKDGRPAADIRRDVNPLELQLLSIVCGVATGQNAPKADTGAPRPLAVVALPAQKVITSKSPAQGR